MHEATAIDRVIGSRLSQLRLSRGLDVNGFAEIIGVTKDDILDYEGGLKRMDARILLIICQKIRVNVVYFFEPWTSRQGGSAVTERLDLAAE